MIVDRTVLVFLFGICVVLMLSILVVVLMRSYIRNLLLDLNGDRERHARFWVAYSSVLMILVPLIISMVFVPREGEETATFFYIVNQVKWSLIGLAATVLVLGIAIHRLVPRTAEKRKEEREEEPA